MQRWWMPCAAALLLWSCSSSDDDKGKPCPEGVVSGQSVDCSCKGGGMGESTCQADKTLTTCECVDGGGSPAGSGGTGGSGGSVATAGTGAGGSGGAGSGAAGADGGAAGSTPSTQDDAGVPPAGDGGMEPEPTPIKTDGTMFALCADGTECGVDLDCYGASSGGGFCASLCTEDTDCESVGDGYTCSSGGMCRQSCTGPDDDSCSNGLQCAMTGGFGGGGGGATFACTYGPNAGQPPAEAFGECMGDQACGGDGLGCAGDTMMTPGFCTTTCTGDDDCADLSAGSGNLEPTCEFIASGPMPSAVCALNCDAADAECPDGMACIVSMGPAASHCGYE